MRSFRLVVPALLAALLIVPRLSAAEGEKDAYAATWAKALTYLRESQDKGGMWSPNQPGTVGMTALVLEALVEMPDRYMTKDVADMMDRAAAALPGYQQESGAIHDLRAPKNYSTSLAVTALAKYDPKRYGRVIDKAVAWIKQQQASEDSGYDKEKHRTYGGFGYGSSLRPDLSNTWIALNALKAAGVPEDDPVWKRAAVFIKRCQNSSEVNDQPYAGEDGGAMYLPGDSPAGKTTTRQGKAIPTSYGSMTYAMVLSYLWCDVKKGDKPVQLAAAWLRNNYSVDRNPNTKKKGQQGLYYYYRVMAKSLSAYGEVPFGDHPWPADLARAVAERQRPDGSWANPEDRWMEGNPVLATSYALHALALAQQAMAGEE